MNCRRFVLVVALAVMAPLAGRGYPPAPHHEIYGQIRDEFGHPVIHRGAEVFLETPSGVRVKTEIAPGLDAGLNYRLLVPMDAGLTPDPYRPNALRTAAPFRLWVRINTVTYLPIEMVASLEQLGQPGGRTRLDLTLGEDSDGDGLPDAWERAMMAAMGFGGGLEDFRPDGVGANGMTHYASYLAGTYPFDPEDGVYLNISGVSEGHPLLEFLSIRGRTYTILGSPDMETWWPVAFRARETVGAYEARYYAREVRFHRIEVGPRPEGEEPLRFFRLTVQ